MIRFIIGKILHYWTFYSHKKKWRKLNSHNFTIAINIFPTDKINVGKYSYGDLKIISYGEENEGLQIGSYVSIANGVQFLLGGNHYYKRFTTYPFRAKLGDGSIETWSKGKIIIEDDVWIGTEALIMSGVIIGRGAIIGARAVVSQNIPAYSIAAGNPARVVKQRFSPEIVKQLKQIDFNDIEPDDVLNNIDIYTREESFEDIRKMLK